MNKVGMGSKYETKYDSNPGVGAYDVVSPTRLTKERKYEAMIWPYDERERKTPGGGSPEPGQYQSKTITFAEGLNKVGMGSKYEFKADKNPAPGQYDVEGSIRATQTRSYQAKIVGAEKTYQRPVESSPEPGQYQA